MERPTRRPKVNKEDKLKLMLEYMREMRVSFPDLLEWYLTVNLRGNSTERRTRWAVDALCRPAVVGALRGRLPWAASIQDFDEELERLVGQPGFNSWDINKLVDEFDLHTSHNIYLPPPVAALTLGHIRRIITQLLPIQYAAGL
jgi:hypothetical protein